MLRPLTRRSLGDDVYGVLRRLIVQGQLPAGAPVIEGRVATVLGVSRTPVREALKRLEYDGLLVTRPGHVNRVSTITLDDIAQVYPLIGVLEGLAARLATPYLTHADLRHMEDLTRQMEQHKRRGEIEQLLRVDTTFHGVVHTRASNPRLHRLVLELRGQMERFEYAYFSTTPNFRISIQRHRKLVRVLRRGNPAASERTLQQQWDLGMEALMELVREERLATAADTGLARSLMAAATEEEGSWRAVRRARHRF